MHLLSPGTNMSSRIFHSDPIGDVWYDSVGAGGVASYGNLIRQTIPNLSKNYWWLRSPVTTRDNWACYVRSVGNLGGYSVYINPYGRESPYTEYLDVYAWVVGPDGDLYHSNVYNHSYGRIYFRRALLAHFLEMVI